MIASCATVGSRGGCCSGEEGVTVLNGSICWIRESWANYCVREKDIIYTMLKSCVTISHSQVGAVPLHPPLVRQLLVVMVTLVVPTILYPVTQV